MIIRQHVKDDAPSEAVYSDCENYRYSLSRIWAPEGRRVMFVMLNPSTASEVQNDPTVERCERRARTLGFGGFRVTNIFAWRATDPKNMRAAVNPIGADNDAVLSEGTEWADDVIAAWGVHGAHLNRGPQVAQRFINAGLNLFHLGLSKQGHPRHPLYLPYRQQPIKWRKIDPIF